MNEYNDVELVAIPSDEKPASDIRRRGGTFEISIEFLRTEPDAVLRIMAHTIVVRAEMKWSSDTIVYDALSPLFDPLEEGAIYPRYDIELDEDGTIRATR